MKKIVILALIVIVVATLVAGLIITIGDRNAKPNKTPAAGGSSSSVQTEPGGEEVALSGSYRCDNDSSFVATFSPSMDEVTIASEGELNVFPHVPSANGQKYETADWSFFFRGEEAVVTEVKTQKSTTCRPPLDTDNAPLNVGD